MPVFQLSSELVPEKVEATNCLIKGQAYFASNKLLVIGQNDGVTNFFAFMITFHLPVERRRFSGFCVGIIWANSVNLNKKNHKYYRRDER